MAKCYTQTNYSHKQIISDKKYDAYSNAQVKCHS